MRSEAKQEKKQAQKKKGGVHEARRRGWQRTRKKESKVTEAQGE